MGTEADFSGEPMTKYFRPALVVVLLSVGPWIGTGATEELNVRMDRVRHSFGALQPYLASAKAFQALDNNDTIYNLLRDLNENFHPLGAINGAVVNEPGFKANLGAVSELLSDSKNRFREGNKVYALWRLRGVSNACISCHAQFHIGATYNGQDAESPLNNFEKGEFYLATRQLEKAVDAFHRAIKDPSLEPMRMNALRKLLIIQTRLSPSPIQAIATLTTIMSEVSIPEVNKNEVMNWITSLNRWNAEPKRSVDSVARAEALIKDSVNSKDLFSQNVDEVGLIRASAILHKALATNKLTPSAKSRSLFLLGYSYSKLPLFFIDELAEIYLEECIQEYPGSIDAKNAFRVYKEKIDLDFTGGQATGIPADVSAHLKELHDKAYAIPSSYERVANESRN